MGLQNVNLFGNENEGMKLHLLASFFILGFQGKLLVHCCVAIVGFVSLYSSLDRYYNDGIKLQA